MDFLKKALDGGHDDSDQKPSDQKPSDHSNADLMSSAKVVLGAAQTQFQHKNSDVDKKEVAAAAANILDAAEKYGKLEENKGVGQYVEKAEDYLRSYSGHSAGAGEAVKDKEKTEGVVEQGGHSAGESHEGDAGDLLKKAGDLLNKE